VLDVDDTLVATGGECKQGMGMSYKAGFSDILLPSGTSTAR
jgi:hypothetical protein